MAIDSYKGVALPWGPALKSFIEPKDNKQVIKTSVLFIVLTGLGERCMMPEFGSPLMRYLFEPRDEAMAASVKQSVMDAISRWDDRVEVLGFDVEFGDDEHTLNCKLLYKDITDPLDGNVYELAFEVSPSTVFLK